MKRKITLFFCFTAMLLFAGCSLSENEFPDDFIQPEDGESMETTTSNTAFDLDSFTATLTQPNWSYGGGNDDRDDHTDNTLPDETEATTDPSAETTTTAVTTAQTAEPAPTETAATETTAKTEIPTQYRLSALPSAKLNCAESPSAYLTESDGQTVLNLPAAAAACGFRADGSVYVLQKDGTAAASLQTGDLLSDADEPVLQTIRFTCGAQTVIIDQRAQAKANYRLPDGTRITKDQAVLLVFLCEQLAAAPETDPLTGIIPITYCETVGGEIYYYIP